MQLGQYDVRNELGRGPRSVVYRAYQRNLNRLVALKVLRRYDDTSKQKFHQEATITANLSHIGIRKVLGAEETEYEGRPLWCVAMEYVDHSLQNMLGRPMPVKKAAYIAAQIADVLHYVHQQGLVHLDVKPANILIFEDGRVVLSDFGIAHPIGERTTDGTPQYMSPEQARNEPVRPASDVYSLGVVLYELLTGRPPYRADHDLAVIRKHADPTLAPVPPRKLNLQLPREAERVTLKALAKDPNQRYATAAELAADLREMASGRISTNITTTITDVFKRIPVPVRIAMLVIPLLILACSLLSTRTPGLLAILRPFLQQTPTPTATRTIIPATGTPTAEVQTPKVTASPRTEEPPAAGKNPTATLKPTPATTKTPTPSPTPEVTPTLAVEAFCPDPKVRITSPAPNEIISSNVPILGTADFDPNEIKYYKVEWWDPSINDWATMGHTHDQPVISGRLEEWKAKALSPGEYQLRLVLVDQVKQEEQTDSECIIPVIIESKE